MSDEELPAEALAEQPEGEPTPTENANPEEVEGDIEDEDQSVWAVEGSPA